MNAELKPGETQGAAKSKDTESIASKITIIIVKTVLLAVWFTFGLAVWIAILVRVMIATMAAVTVSLIGDGSTKNIYGALDKVSNMWPRGLKHILQINNSNPEKELYFDKKNNIDINVIIKFILETGYAIIFFGSIFWAFGGFKDLIYYKFTFTSGVLTCGAFGLFGAGVAFFSSNSSNSIANAVVSGLLSAIFGGYVVFITNYIL